MKLISVIFSALFTISSFADTTYQICTNGEASRIGDRFFQVNLYEDGIGFYPYETSFEFDANEIQFDKNTYSIINKQTSFTSEGENTTKTVNALLILDEKNNNLNMAISFDYGPFTSYEMRCRTVN